MMTAITNTAAKSEASRFIIILYFLCFPNVIGLAKHNPSRFVEAERLYILPGVGAFYSNPIRTGKILMASENFGVAPASPFGYQGE